MKKDSEIKFSSNRWESHLAGKKALTISQACNLLQQARVKSCDLISSGSNYVFMTLMTREKMEVKAIYKPCRGEAPLWDFPSGTLYKREYAAFVVSQSLEWQLIPPTVIRDGPHGVGSMQWFVDTRKWTKQGLQIKDLSILKQVALFDYLVNNADRKAGHFLADEDGRLWLVDHGLTFNAELKLRTVLWDYSGEPIPEELLADVRSLQSKLNQEKQLRDELCHLLEDNEIEALELRVKSVLEKPVFVQPGPYRSVPWPWF